MSNLPLLLFLQEAVGYSFQNPSLLREAVTHKSFVNEYPGGGLRHNERLEFLGDAVLDLVISTYLMETFINFQEGDLSRLKAAVVSEPALAEIARSLDLGRYLFLGKGEEQTGGRQKASLLANTLEALIAAIYLDGGLEPSRKFVCGCFSPMIAQRTSEGVSLDYKTDLQEYCQERGMVLPRYRLAGETGPDHQKVFEVELWIGNVVWGRGEGKSKKEAEQQAAREALKGLRNSGMSP